MSVTFTPVPRVPVTGVKIPRMSDIVAVRVPSVMPKAERKHSEKTQKPEGHAEEIEIDSHLALFLGHA